MRSSLARLAVLLAATTTVAAESENAVWVLRLARERHPVQERVRVRPLLDSEHFTVLVPEGQPLPGENRLPPGGVPAVIDQLEEARSRLQQWNCPTPWRKVTILLWDSGWPEAAWFSPFDLMGQERALAHGFHANPQPVLVASFPYADSQTWRNTASLVEAFFLVTALPPTDPFPTALSRSAARWAAYRLGLTPSRALWGDQEPHRPGPSSWSPLRADGWGPLFVEFLARNLGPEAGCQLVQRQDAPTGALVSLLTSQKPATAVEDAASSFWAQLWLPPIPAPSSPETPLAVSPRPQLLAWIPASRPASGQATVGVGGGGLVVVEGDGSATLPLSLQGDPSGRWVGAMQKASPLGLSPLRPVRFDLSGFARVEVPPLGPDERLLVFLAVLPHPSGEAEERFLPLHWGLAWSPRIAPNRTHERLRELTSKRLGEASPALRTRVLDTLRVLAGLQSLREGLPVVTSRYAWSPAAENVVAALLAQAERRGLRVEQQRFLRSTPWGTTGEWTNLVIRLPGSNPRRLPVVLAAHWDACGPDPFLSYRSARGVVDNALGVVTVLETASLLAATPQSIPVEVVFLAGGCHDAAGAQAYLASRQGNVAVWVELESLWARESPDPSRLVLRLGETTSLLTPRLPGVFRRWGFTVELADDPPPPHTGSALAERQGAMTLTVSGPRTDNARAAAWSPEAELARVSPDYVLLLAAALEDLVAALGGR